MIIMTNKKPSKQKTKSQPKKLVKKEKSIWEIYLGW